jgi:hypothetical protein
MDKPNPTIIPAQPDWFRLWLDPETGELVLPDPILAWAVWCKSDDGHPVDAYAQPITTEGFGICTVYGDSVYLLRPSGLVEEQGGPRWNCIKDANTPEECAKRRGSPSARSHEG